MGRRAVISLAWRGSCFGAALVVCALVWAGRSLAATPVQVDVTFTGAAQVIPRSFFGISLEVHELRRYEDQATLFGRAISLTRPDRDAPMLLRVGGIQSDATYWGEPAGSAPRGVFLADEAWLRRLAELVRQSDFRLILGLNVPVHSPSMAADFARATRKALPTRLAGLEIGNEPNVYRHYGLYGHERVRRSLPVPSGWSTHYTPADYWRDFKRYAKALGLSVPGVPLAGPDLAGSNRAWLVSMPGPWAGGPRFLTFHHYPFTTCWGELPGERQYLAGDASEAAQWNALTATAHARGQEVRVTEMNSMSLCGGDPLVVRSFATALWAPDALFEMLDHGIDGVNWHVRAEKPNAPFRLTASGLEVRPELYGLATFARTVGSARRMLHLRVRRQRPINLRAWAVDAAGGPRILLINKGTTPAQVTLRVTGRRTARIERLLATSLGVAPTVTLGGRTIGTDGRWHGAAVATVVAIARGAVRVSVPRYSAAIVTLH